MRTKNREINIFNMSLLDILTGALGAFMFMMLSFVPYYNIVMQQQLQEDPNKEKIEKSELDDLKKQKKKVEELQEEIQQLEKEKKALQEKIDELIEKLKNCGKGDVSAEELAKLEEELNLLRKENEELKAKIKALLAEIDSLEATIEDLKKQNTLLTVELDKLRKEIEALKKEIQLLKDRLSKIREGNPQAEALLMKANADISALKRTVRIAVIIDHEADFELAILDPKKVWFNQDSTFPLGRKSMRVRGRRSRGFELETFVRAHLQQGPKNMLLLTADAFLMQGTYYLGIIGRGRPPEESVGPDGTVKPQVTPKKVSPFQGLFDDFGSPGPGARPTPPGPLSLNSNRTFSLFNGAPWIPENAYAQSSVPLDERVGGGPPKLKPYPAHYPKAKIRGFAMVNHGLEIFQASEMPTQEVPIYWWMSIIGVIRVPPADTFEFRWYPPRLGDKPEEPENLSWGMETGRIQLEGKLNSESYFPLKSTHSCRSNIPCLVEEDDRRGTLEKRDVIPQFSLDDEPPAETGGPRRDPIPVASIQAMRDAARSASPTPTPETRDTYRPQPPQSRPEATSSLAPAPTPFGKNP